MNGETILVVDDNKEIVYSISELLKYEGYQIVKAYDGMEALKALETNQIKRRCLLSGMESRNEKNGASSSSDRYSGICSSRYLLCAAE